MIINYTIRFTFLSLMFVSVLIAQNTSLVPVSEKSGEVEANDVYYFHHATVMEAESSAKSISSLNTAVTIEFTNANLSQIINQIAKDYNVNFVFEDQLLNIKGINYSSHHRSLHDVLTELLDPYNISFYEYGTGKIALAKRTKIDEKTGGVKGVVKDETGELLWRANIMIKELKIGCSSDMKGNYQIKNLKPGTYTFEVSFVGYETSAKKVKVTAGQIIEINFTLKSTAFQIGGIEVIGSSGLLPKDVNSKTTITSGEIEHYQASSLKDVLDLVPGVQKSDNPGLGKTSQIAVRGDESDQYTAFGTLIVIDGTPISNNANMQFERLQGSKFGGSNTGRGVDLRTIPADNIEDIEVITGLPSVRYGDVTAGIINVQTKIGKAPHRLKIKNNPDTREGNFGGGILVGEGSLSYNFNVAQSERDIRKTGDEYFRLTAQTVYSANLLGTSLNTNNKIMFQRVLDEEEPKGDMQQTRNYNRGYTLSLSSWGKYRPDDGISAIDYSLFATMRRENSMKSKLNSEYVVLPNGDTAASYIGKVENRGIEWTLGGRLEYNKIFYTGNVIHKVLFGIDPQYNVNTGEGVVFDTSYSYYGLESGRRPYRFDDIPGQFLASLYVEDKLTGNFIFDYNIMLGFRYEMYRPYGFNLAGLWGNGDLVKSYQGSFFNPRLNIMIYLSDANQLRISAGTSSKSPPMSTLYPPESVFKWRNPVDGSIDYYRYDKKVPYLKGYKETLYEIAYDHKFYDMLGTTISAYYKKRTDSPVSKPYPVFRSGTDANNNLYIYYIDQYTLPENLGVSYSKGIEFTLRTSRIKKLNMDFQITGAYNHINTPGKGFNYSATPDQSIGRYPNYLVPGLPVDTLIGWVYPSSSRWNDRFQLNYYAKYTLASLGLWITFRAEQLVFERNQNYNLTPLDYNLLNESSKLDRAFEEEIKIKPNKWLFNLSMSKSLFKGAEISFYVNNFFNDAAVRRYMVTRTTESEESRNPPLFYGIEFSMSLEGIFGGGSNNEIDD